MDDRNNKFQFIDVEDITDESVENNIEIVSSPEKVKVDNIDIKKDEVLEEKEVIEDNSIQNIVIENNNKDTDTENTIDISKRRHFSFEARIIVSVIAILVLFVGACFLGLKVINHTTTKLVGYVENGDFTYQLCLKDATCQPENITYHGDDVNIIKMSFKYDANYEEKLNYNKYYRVTSVISAYSNDGKSLLYEKENDLVDRTNIADNSSKISINEIVVIDYSKYRDLVKNYENGKTQAEVILYLEEDNETRKVASLVIPLTKDNFELTKYTTTNAARSAKVNVNVWDTYSLVYAIATSFLTLISLILIYRTTRLVLKVTNNKSDYELAVDDLLKEYDEFIVIARDGYESNEDKEIIKIETFKELLDIKNMLNKPIVFYTVNDVKCEFIVEDEKVLYKYIIKEADFIN